MEKFYSPKHPGGRRERHLLTGLRSSLLFAVFFVLALSLQAVARDDTDSAALQNTVAPKITIIGTVLDQQKQPVIGATIVVKGNMALGGAITDLNGNFKFTVPEGSTLQVTCVGFMPFETTAVDTSRLVVQLVEDSKAIENVVVVGYGVQNKESVVGAISQVDNESIVNSGTSNVTNAIAGKLSGVQTFQTSGQPGRTDATIVVRGLSSWNGNSPLVMVDGVERDFSSIDPNEVKTISVLKDASATAVFGAKGANGVILVTTRTGSVGKAKMRLSVDYGLDRPTRLPDHISSYETGMLANVAMKNSGQYGALFSDRILSEYKNPSTRLNSVRYPDTNFYDLLLNDYISNLSTNFNVSGGSDRVKYFVSAGYAHESSLIKKVYNWKNTDYTYDRFNYRSNLDVNVTKTTLLSLKVGGSTAIQQYPNTNGTSTNYLFTYLYKASPMMYPAYYPAWMLEEIPDPDNPSTGDRMATAAAGLYKSSSPNPYQYFGVGDFEQKTTSELFTDIVLDQKLDFITKGLSFNAKASLSSSFYRISRTGESTNPNFRFNWDVFDSGVGNPWELLSSNTSGGIYVVPPYAVTEQNTAKDQVISFNWETSLKYDRKFGNHNVTALALFHQREYNKNAAFPKRTQGFVARATYDYKLKYLLEMNMGYTGSEQFSPQHRYGFFPSAAVGYVISQERFWKESMPWWSKFKIRYSDGLVGSDQTSSSWLYYSSYTQSGGYIYEDKGANLDAHWETAHKRDVGVEMGWFDDRLTLSVDLFDEQRKDMLIAPISTPLIGIDYKEVNRGRLKKHGMEIELGFADKIGKDFNYHIGGMIGLNECRILEYEEALYTPEYQKNVNKPFDVKQGAGSFLNGMNSIGNGYFNSIDEIHGYPAFSTTWSSIYPGVYQLLDYTGDGTITTEDLHAIKGLSYPPMVYSFKLGFEWRGFKANVLFYGNWGKWIPVGKAYAKEFGGGDYLIHENQLDYWRPDNRGAAHAALSFNDDALYGWAGGTFNSNYVMMLPERTWQKADYLSLKEVLVEYKFSGRKIKRALGIEALSLNMTGNNLLMLTGLTEGDPQFTNIGWNYYPVMASIKFGVKVTF